MTKRSRPVRRETTRKRTSPRLAPRRVVDPTGWLERCRRLARDFERLTAHAEAMIHIAMTGLMLRRLTGQETRYRNNNRHRTIQPSM